MANEQPDLLRGIPPADAAQVLALGVRRTVPGGANLFELGDPAGHLFLIERGRIKLTLPMQVRGHAEDVFVEERMPGETIGWSALIPPCRFTLKATALLETEVIALSADELRAHFAAHPEVGYAVSLNLATVVGQRLQLFQAMWLREMQRMVEMACV